MPLQNRVTPWGELVRDAGTRHHARQSRRQVPSRRPDAWGAGAGPRHHWIACELHYKDMHHEPMGKGYTSLFFLDEVTALAAGHRPCFFCRRAGGQTLHGARPGRVEARCLRPRTARGASGVASTSASDGSEPSRRVTKALFPTVPMVAIGEAAFAVRGGHLLRWSPGGYLDIVKRNAAMPSLLLTPPRIIAILARGYRPRWHPSADALIGGRQ